MGGLGFHHGVADGRAGGVVLGEGAVKAPGGGVLPVGVDLPFDFLRLGVQDQGRKGLILVRAVEGEGQTVGPLVFKALVVPGLGDADGHLDLSQLVGQVILAVLALVCDGGVIALGVVGDVIFNLGAGALPQAGGLVVGEVVLGQTGEGVGPVIGLCLGVPADGPGVLRRIGAGLPQADRYVLGPGAAVAVHPGLGAFHGDGGLIDHVLDGVAAIIVLHDMGGVAGVRRNGLGDGIGVPVAVLGIHGDLLKGAGQLGARQGQGLEGTAVPEQVDGDRALHAVGGQPLLLHGDGHLVLNLVGDDVVHVIVGDQIVLAVDGGYLVALGHGAVHVLADHIVIGLAGQGVTDGDVPGVGPADGGGEGDRIAGGCPFTVLVLLIDHLDSGLEAVGGGAPLLGDGQILGAGEIGVLQLQVRGVLLAVDIDSAAGDLYRDGTDAGGVVGIAFGQGLGQGVRMAGGDVGEGHRAGIGRGRDLGVGGVLAVTGQGEGHAGQGGLGVFVHLGEAQSAKVALDRGYREVHGLQMGLGGLALADAGPLALIVGQHELQRGGGIGRIGGGAAVRIVQTDAVLHGIAIGRRFAGAGGLDRGDGRIITGGQHVPLEGLSVLGRGHGVGKGSGGGLPQIGDVGAHLVLHPPRLSRQADGTADGLKGIKQGLVVIGLIGVGGEAAQPLADGQLLPCGARHGAVAAHAAKGLIPGHVFAVCNGEQLRSTGEALDGRSHAGHVPDIIGGGVAATALGAVDALRIGLVFIYMESGGSVRQQHGIEVLHPVQRLTIFQTILQQVPGQHQAALDVSAALAVAVAHPDSTVQPGADDVLQRGDIGGAVGSIVDIIPLRGIGLGIAAERDDLHQTLVALLSAGLGGEGVDEILGRLLRLGQASFVNAIGMVGRFRMPAIFTIRTPLLGLIIFTTTSALPSGRRTVIFLAALGAVVHTVGHVQHQHHGAVGGLAGDGGQVLGGLDLERDLKLILHLGPGHTLGNLQDGVAGLFCGLGHAVAVLLEVPRAARIHDLGGTVVLVLHPGRKGGGGQEAQHHHQR